MIIKTVNSISAAGYLIAGLPQRKLQMLKLYGFQKIGFIKLLQNNLSGIQA
ncbi:hypothetical protein BMS3Abin03_02094 [bacterium BMS3Abin03]|nr:hypothetical protein BMS3Abin03_02094 [bacterium BMS3Abin03]